MKMKLRKSALFLSVLILLLFCFLPGWGQIKIGQITVADNIAKEYFVWCEHNPDTLWFTHSFAYYEESSDSNMCIGTGYMLSSYEAGLSENELYIKDICADRKFIYKDEEGWSHYSEKTGYIMKRKMSEIDFREWFIGVGKKSK